MQTYFNLVLNQQKQIDQLQDIVRRLRLRNSKLKQLVGNHIKVEDQSDDSSVQQLNVSQISEQNNNILEQILAQSKENKKDNNSISSADKVKNCKICNKSYINKSGLLKHYQKVHQIQQATKSKINKIEKSDDKAKYCEICNKIYSSRSGYMKHCRRMHSNKSTKKNRTIKINPVEIVDDIIVKPEV